MNLNKWTALVLCAGCLLVAGCTAENETTISGSDEWSRGVILDTSEEDAVAVAVWEDATFVVWATGDGHLQLAQLDAALALEGVTDLAVTAAYPRDMSLEAEAADRLHLVWMDSIEGVRTIIYAQVAPGEAEPVSQQEIRLPDEAYHVQPVMRPEAERLEIFWSADDDHNSGIYHRAVSPTGDDVAPDARLTEAGWQPGVGWGPSRALDVTWVEEGKSGYLAIWHARFDPKSQSLENVAPVTEVRLKRGRRFQGSAVGGAGAQAVVAWTIGRRFSVGLGADLNPPTHESEIAAALARARGTAFAITSDKGQYVMISSVPGEMASPVYPLTSGAIAEIWKQPQMRTMGDRTWVFFSSWVAQRSDVRMQLVVVPFDEEGAGEPTLVTGTRPASMSPDLAVGTDGTLRATWVEPLGNDMFRVVVASTTPEARDALGGFRLGEWLGKIAAFVFENLSLLGYAPLVLLWTVLPLGVVVVATLVKPSGVQEWQAAAWLGAAVLVQLVCKRLIAPGMMPFGPNPVQIILSVVPVMLGIGLMWIYWRRAKEPLLLAAYGLFVGIDAFFSLFVALPRLLWPV